MKIIITESQHKRLFEEEQKVLQIPGVKVFGDWDGLQKFLESKGNPQYSLGGNLNLVGLKVESLGNLVSVEGDIYAYDTPLKSLGSLTSVGGNLDLDGTPVESLENLTYVGGDLFLTNTPMSNKWLQIKQMIDKVGGDIYFE
jgi:hypothetical protein